MPTIILSTCIRITFILFYLSFIQEDLVFGNLLETCRSLITCGITTVLRHITAFSPICINLCSRLSFKGIGSNINRLTVLANMDKVRIIGLDKAAQELSEVSAALRSVMEGR